MPSNRHCTCNIKVNMWNGRLDYFFNDDNFRLDQIISKRKSLITNIYSKLLHAPPVIFSLYVVNVYVPICTLFFLFILKRIKLPKYLFCYNNYFGKLKSISVLYTNFSKIKTLVSGHSRTIIGYEKHKDGKAMLLVLDPSHSPAQVGFSRETTGR